MEGSALPRMKRLVSAGAGAASDGGIADSMWLAMVEG